MSINHNFKDLSNKQFGHLTALHIDHTRISKQTYWVCQCVCGKKRSLQTYQLTSGKVTSCGCKNTGRHFIIPSQRRLHSLYTSMLARCSNPKSISYKCYGAKGISVCDEWKNSFQSFAEWSFNNGYADNLSIDRIDNTKGYFPDNCRWVTMRNQYMNKTTSALYTHNGKTLMMKEWCALLNFPYSLAKSRRKEAKKHHIEPTFEYVFSPPKFTKSKSN